MHRPATSSGPSEHDLHGDAGTPIKVCCQRTMPREGEYLFIHWVLDMAGNEYSRAAISDWQEAEIKRSAHEASSIDIASLRIYNTKRYLDPLPSTFYPLEYCYCLVGDGHQRVAVDLGCGTGENTLLLALLLFRVYAIDISPELIALAQKRLEVNHAPTHNVQFLIGSAYGTPLLDESVDIVFGIGILHHLDLTLAQQEVYRILKRGGLPSFRNPYAIRPLFASCVI